MQADMLIGLWSGLDRCDGCKDPLFADAGAPPPARPFRAPAKGAVLFVGEAPPKTGGFWIERSGDAVRRLLLPALPSWPGDVDWDSKEAIDWFVGRGYLFIQAMKWTLIGQSYLKLGAEEGKAALRHAVERHLLTEIGLIAPSAIVALGTAAWRAAALIAESYGRALEDNGVSSARLRHHELPRPGGDMIPLHATFLPGTINDGLARSRMDAMRDDVRVFLRCVAGEKCESFSPSVQAPQKKRDPGFHKWWKDARARLKAAGLYPLPEGMTFEAAMHELDRRERRGPA